MSFINKENIITLIEDLLVKIWKLCGYEIPSPFKRLTFNEAMTKYGIDKPDLRYGFEIQNINDSLPICILSVIISI